jgi:hypothetical protein
MSSATTTSTEERDRQSARAHGWAIASVVLALVWLGGIGSVLAVSLAVAARRTVRRHAGSPGDYRVATVGLVLGNGGVAVAERWPDWVRLYRNFLGAVVSVDLRPQPYSSTSNCVGLAEEVEQPVIHSEAKERC